jgi:hypothetical protein
MPMSPMAFRAAIIKSCSASLCRVQERPERPPYPARATSLRTCAAGLSDLSPT